MAFASISRNIGTPWKEIAHLYAAELPVPWGQSERVNVVDKITELPLSELVVLDAERLNALIRTYGAHAAEDMICKGIEDLATRLSLCETAAGRADTHILKRELRQVRALAGQMGMTLLCMTVDRVQDCLGTGDPVALSATVARMVRAGDKSLYAVWDVEGLSV